ncbi:hypothetical protein M422DRAFT_268986 [Sphaerobolus stellatus SS14]|uniref:Uncharacterized protein n=1 Tax=Sphaerobolus stellatus (strain SS14) TaxID=990650 RepID=A0A0C9TJ57_SPHS4|nr:hypothetical protein M422DRAFT_268986 [Sphaerobolus stellatus SS14]
MLTMIQDDKEEDPALLALMAWATRKMSVRALMGIQLQTISALQAIEEDEGTSRPRPVISGRKIDLEYLVDMTIEECEWAFRFTQHELQRVVDMLEISDPFRTQDGHRFTAIEAFALLCARFRMPEDQFSLSTNYARSQTAISQDFNELSCWNDKTWGHVNIMLL